MAFTFVILLHLIGIFILSAVLALIAGVITFFLSGKKRTRRVFFALLSPFIGLYTLYFTALFLAGIVSEYKRVDIGFGDSWYVPLSGTCELVMIDLPENAGIQCGDHTFEIFGISGVQQIGNVVVGKTDEGKYFSFNTTTNELKKDMGEEVLYSLNMNEKITLENPNDFYLRRRDEILGHSMTVVGILSLIITLAILYLVKRIVQGSNKTKTPLNSGV